MSGTLALPLHCSLDTTDYVFKITQVGSGGYAIWAESYGTDPWGDVPTGVLGQSDIGNGVFGFSTSGVGIFGQSQSSTAIVGTGGYNGVHGVTANPHASGVWGENTASGYGVGGKSAGGIGVYGTGTPAGYFDGDVQVQGDVGVLGDVLLYNPSSGDVAEDFDLDDGSTQAEPGTVLVIGPSGRLSASMAAYDTRVAGVVSGAGSLTPAIVLQRVKSRAIRSPVALIGKVYCKVDASFGRICAGDLLTTSSTTGHAMKVTDLSRAFGAVLGKALGSGQGLIPILVSLR